MHYFEEWLLPEERGLIPYTETMTGFVKFITEKYPDHVALSDPTKSVTYAEMGERIARRRQFLAEMEIPAGSNIGLFDVNSIDEVEWFLAVTSFGCTAVMIPAQLSPEVLAGASRLYQLKLILAGEAVMAKTSLAPVPVKPMASMAETQAPAVETKKKDRAAIFFTGGTTGAPKGVVLNNGAMVRGPYNGIYRPKTTIFNQVAVTALPLTHVFGMVFSTLTILYTGGHVGMCAQMKDLFKEMMRVHPNVMIAVPGMADIMLTVARTRGIGVLGGNLKLIVCGAAPVPPRLRTSFKEFDIEVLAGYGLTESSNLVCGNFEMDDYPSSVGMQYPEQEKRLVDGELQVRGDMLFDGYWNDPARTAEVFTEDGWFRTGDLARFDEKGMIYIVGRSKNLIILPNGENVSPEEVEEVYYRSNLVKDCLVYEDEIAGTPAIVMEAQPAEGVADDAMMEDIRKITATLPTTMRPARITVRHEDFAKSPSMKIIRGKGNGAK